MLELRVQILVNLQPKLAARIKLDCIQRAQTCIQRAQTSTKAKISSNCDPAFESEFSIFTISRSIATVCEWKLNSDSFY